MMALHPPHIHAPWSPFGRCLVVPFFVVAGMACQPTRAADPRESAQSVRDAKRPSGKPAEGSNLTENNSKPVEPQLPAWPEGPFEPSRARVENGILFRFMRQIEAAAHIPPLATSPEPIDVRIQCSVKRFVRVIESDESVVARVYTRSSERERARDDRSCAGRRIAMREPVVGGSELCPRSLDADTSKKLLERLQAAGLWEVRSRWSAGDPGGPQVIITARRTGEMPVLASVNSYIGEGGDEERRVVRVLNDFGLCSPRPPG